MTKGPTPTQLRLLDRLYAYIIAYPYAPSIEELRVAGRYKSRSTVHALLLELRRQGLVDWVEGEARTLHLTRDGYKIVAPEEKYL